MVAVGAIAPVERHDQEVRPDEPAKHLRRALPFQDGIAELPRQAVQDGRLDQEVQRLLVEAREEDVTHVVDDEPIVAVEVREGGLGLASCGQR